MIIYYNNREVVCSSQTKMTFIVFLFICTRKLKGKVFFKLLFVIMSDLISAKKILQFLVEVIKIFYFKYDTRYLQ